MQLHNLQKSTARTKKRVGQGHGSGRVKTAGRGTKGQKARGTIPAYFEGGALPLTKRLPFQRGKSKNKSLQTKPITLTLTQLSKLPTKSVVDQKLLIKVGLVNQDEVKNRNIKILGTGTLNQALTVTLPVSKTARAAIEKAGGTVS